MRAKKTTRNRPIHHRNTKTSRGISPVISTIIISGTLLTILVIASFVSVNVLELQIASTEFEQAKTNMMLLDEVIQDVALRGGAGGYVQFNQRSGGIGITEHAETIQIWGPGEQTSVINSSSSIPEGTWTTPTNAYQSNNQYASTSSENAMQQYGNYGFSIPSGAIITKVEVGYEAYATKGTMKITCSWNGIDWAEEISASLATGDPNEVTWVDFTVATSWSPDKLSDANFRTRVRSEKARGGVDIFLDWIPVKVTYVPLTSPIYESPSLVSLVYRGGSKVSGTDITLRGSGSLIVDMTNALSHLRIETGQGVQIKLDYHRVRITEMGSLIVNGTLTNFIEVTFLRLERGNMGGSGTVNVKVQNIRVNTTTRVYEDKTVTIKVQLGLNQPESRTFTSEEGEKTVVMFTEIVVQIFTA